MTIMQKIQDHEAKAPRNTEVAGCPGKRVELLWCRMHQGSIKLAVKAETETVSGPGSAPEEGTTGSSSRAF
jgi:hypothetical protein